MPENNPITDAELAEVKRLHAAATPGEWQAQTYSNYAGWSVWAPDGAGCIAERWYPTGTQDEIPRNDLWIVASHNAFGPLIARLEAAERERDELREELAYIKQQLEWVEENGDTYQKSALMDFIRRTIHGISHTAAMKEALAARDAQQRREGAAAENDYWADEHEGLLGGHVSAAHVVRAFNLREGGE